jgi:hypothetical protein
VKIYSSQINAFSVSTPGGLSRVREDAELYCRKSNHFVIYAPAPQVMCIVDINIASDNFFRTGRNVAVMVEIGFQRRNEKRASPRFSRAEDFYDVRSGR